MLATIPESKNQTNSTDRLSKYLAKFGLKFKELHS